MHFSVSNACPRIDLAKLLITPISIASTRNSGILNFGTTRRDHPQYDFKTNQSGKSLYVALHAYLGRHATVEGFAGDCTLSNSR